MAAHHRATQATALQKLHSLSYRPNQPMYARKEDKREGGREEEEGDSGRERREMEGERGGREVVTFCEGEELAHVMPGMSSLVKVSLLP